MPVMRPLNTPSLALLHVPLLAVSSFLPITRAWMPYNPTRLLRNGSFVYVFQQAPHSLSQFELGSVDISSKILASDLPYTTLYPTLPFLDAHSQQPFTPILENDGNMTVYSGDCAAGAKGAQIWSFTPGLLETNGNGSWVQKAISVEENARKLPTIGSNYLSDGIAFSAIVDGDEMDSRAYFFGGMCPFQDSNDDNWQSAANYSNRMVNLEPNQNGKRSLTYQLDASSSRGPPIAEAGFTLTGLLPSFSNHSDGSQTQQQNFILVGGHTSSAFINMSQVALFTLPQQAWTFVPVSQPDAPRTDLTMRNDIDTIDPRSGHSATLTPDGRHIIVFGGWVGDISNPAKPQLAILNVGDGYGGEGDWEWTVPDPLGAGLEDGTGIYGHGAAMLPGGIMMIMGGRSIPAPASRKRGSSPSMNTQTLFLNVSSTTWIKEYSPPPEAEAPGSVNSGPLSSPGQKAGLGVGLGVGVAAVFTLLAFYLWYSKRLKRQREAREKQIQDLAMNAHRYNLDFVSTGFDGRGAQPDAVDYLDESDPYVFPGPNRDRSQGRRRTNGNDAERTGLLVEIPSPTRGLRRSHGGRANHQMPRYDEWRVRGSGHIHPIDELEEEQDEPPTDKTPLTRPEMSERSAKQRFSVFENMPVLDPFTDAGPSSAEPEIIFHSAPTSPQREVPDELNHASYSCTDSQPTSEALLPRQSSPNSTGRSSPTKPASDRTGSNLSERSTRSNPSSTSDGEIPRRSASMRSAAILNHALQTNPFESADDSPATDKANRNNEANWQAPADTRARSFTSIRSAGRDADSYATARSSFVQLQAEGEALLGGSPDRTRPDTSSTTNGSSGQGYRDTDGSVSRAGTITAATSAVEGSFKTSTRERRKSWLGSVRRALSRTTPTTDRTRSLTTTTPPMEPYTDNPASPTLAAKGDKRRSFPASAAPPRRAASDASFWRSRRGRQDWLEDELDCNDPRAKWRRNSGDDWGAPEDVAFAERERQREEWRQRNNMLINLNDDGALPTPRTPIGAEDLGVPGKSERPGTPADEEDWDVEAAIERRVVQVMFTVPKSKLRVVNADIERSSVMSLPRENSSKDEVKAEESSNSGTASNRVRDLAGRFEQMSSSGSPPRASPRPSRSPSIKSAKIRAQRSSRSLSEHGGGGSRKASNGSTKEKGKERAGEKER